jgi:glyoxylase-like metal-dependent hydrolase (beta-lactamase superfamily II)
MTRFRARTKEIALHRIARFLRSTSIVLLALAGTALGAPSAAAQTFYMGQVPEKAKVDTTLTITVHPLAPGVYAAKVRYAWVGWFEQGKSITLVDAAMDEQAGAALEDTIRARSGQLPIDHVIITHPHEDHLGGAKRFLSEGASLVAQAQVAAEVDSLLGRPHVTKAAKKGGDAPTILVDHILKLGTGDRAAEVIWLGHPAHSTADLIVYLPKARVLFAGDIVSNRSVPWMLDPDMNIDGWRTSVDSLMSARFEVDSLVPGHGQIGGQRPAAGWTKRYLEDAWDKASKVAGWGKNQIAYKEWGYLGAYEDTEFYMETHFMNMRRLLNEAKGVKTPGRRGARALKY